MGCRARTRATAGKVSENLRHHLGRFGPRGHGRGAPAAKHAHEKPQSAGGQGCKQTSPLSKCFPAGTRTRVSRVRAVHPNQLDYRGHIAASTPKTFFAPRHCAEHLFFRTKMTCSDQRLTRSRSIVLHKMKILYSKILKNV